MEEDSATQSYACSVGRACGADPEKSRIHAQTRFRVDRFGAVASILLILATMTAFGSAAWAVETIAGSVIDATNGAPLAFIDLDVFDASGSSVPIGATATDALGQYLIVLPGAGSYRVRADPSTGSGLGAMYYNQTPLKSQALAISVAVGQAVAGITIALPHGVLLNGRVTASGVPVAGMNMDVFASNGEFLGAYPSISDAAGNFVIGSLPVGTYFVRAKPALPSLLVRQFFGGSMEIAGAAPVAVGASAVSGVNIDLAQGGTISGTITDATTAQGLANIDLDVFDANGAKLTPNARSGIGGGYEIGALPQGNFTLRADPTAVQGFADQFYTGAIAIEFATPISVNVGTTTPSIDFSLPLAGSISGVVLDPSGLPVAGIDFDVFDAATGIRLAQTAISDATGAYQVPSLNSGDYSIRADPAPAFFLAREYFDAVSRLAIATPVAVLSGVDTANIQFMLAGGGSISGSVLDIQTNTPIAGAAIDLLQAGTFLLMDQTTTTAADGRFTVGALPAGGYLLRATPPMGDAAHGPSFFGDVNLASLATPVSVVVGSVAPGSVIHLPEPSIAVGLGSGLVALCLVARRGRGLRRHVRG